VSLSKDRVLLEGVSPHGHEREAIAFVKAHLPDIEPFRIWALFELVEPTGRRYEIDLLVLGYHCLYLIEIKSHPGRVGGDVVDFRVTFPDGRTRVMPNPFPLISSKARVLASMLERVMGKGRPWVEPLVFLSADGVEVTLEDAAAKGVVTRKTLLRALQFGEYPGAPEGAQRAPITRHKAVEISQALKSLGLRKSDSPLRVGELAVGELIEETAGTQDFEAQHERMPSIRRRVRTYLVPESPTQERREQLRRAAEREAKTLTLLGDHPAILRLTDYVAEGPTGGPCLVFDHFAEALPLDLFLRQHPTLPFEQRIQILEQLGDALDYCHRKQLLHRGLYPGAVLVRLAGEPARIELRLYNFQLAAQRDGSGGTVHLSALGADRAALYRAPEVIVDPGRASPASDVFSLGVMAYHVLTGSPPGSSLAERKALLLAAGGNLSVAAARDDLAGASADTRKSLDDVVRFATEENPINRADDAMEWVKLLLEAITTPTPPAEPSLDPLLARPGDRLEGGLEVVAPLGTGSTAKVLSVRRADRLFALKIALGPEHDATLRAEAEVLSRLASERIVRFEALLTVGGRACLLTTYAGETLADILTRDGAQSLDYARRWGEDLLRAVEVLEEAGIQHRDIKPANLGVLPGEAKKARHLFLFDFSLSALDPAAVTAGTPAYRDPGVPTRGRWDAAADRYAAAITLYELLTGTRPRPATDSDLEVELDAERFDAAVRGRLVAFFRRTFARDLSLRQEDADTLRSEWVACLVASPGTSPPGPLSLKGEGEERGGEGPESRVSAPSAPLLDLAALTDDTPVEALPLGVRERNALDRSGVVTLRDLLAVPPTSSLPFAAWGGTRRARSRPSASGCWRRGRASAPRRSTRFSPGFAAWTRRSPFCRGCPQRRSRCWKTPPSGALRSWRRPPRRGWSTSWLRCLALRSRSPRCAPPSPASPRAPPRTPSPASSRGSRPSSPRGRSAAPRAWAWCASCSAWSLSTACS
jgi:serine/threonine protein kinase